MDSKSPGVIVRNKFVVPSDVKNFKDYLSYKNRTEASREAVLKRYEQYEEYVNAYMNNAEKATGLFTAENDRLSKEQFDKMGEIFETAKINGSLLWQPIISFDNSFLEENGLYRSENHWLDESRLREYVRNGMKRMLHNENLDYAVWAGSFHYNTDNIHVHIAIVEPEPTRKRKIYERNGKMYEEVVGKFQKFSIEKCKSYIANAIVGEKKMNIRINDLIRNCIVAKKREIDLHTEVMFRHEFLTIYDQLPKNKSYWNYNNSHMRILRPMLDDLSRRFIYEYQSEEFRELKELMWEQNQMYHRMYGKSKSETDYLLNKNADLYARLGNAILKEMKAYDDELQQESILRKIPDEIDYENLSVVEAIPESIIEEYGADAEEILDFPDEDTYVKWTEEYKTARKFLFGTKKDVPQLDRAFVEMSLEAGRGNVFAMYDMGDIFYYGRGVEPDKEKAEFYYEQSFNGFAENLKNDDDDEKGEWIGNYVIYRIGKMYHSGKGVEQNYEKAFSYYSGSELKYAKYSQGLMYRDGKGIQKDKEAAFKNFKEASREGMPYANYELGKMYERGEGTVRDLREAEFQYGTALSGFLNMLEESADDKLYYRVGKMHETGKGTDFNLEEAIKYYKKAAYLGNVYAHVALGNIYAQSNEIDKVKLAIHYLQQASEMNYDAAQYELGKLYLKGIPEVQDYQKAEYYLKQAAEQGNEYAEYELGKLYLKDIPEMQDYKKAEYYLKQASNQGNEYVQYTLGKMYLTGSEEYRNLDLAENYFILAADNGNEYAKYILGKLYSNRQTNKYDPKKAEKYLIELSKAGNERARFALGQLYRDKDSVLYDRGKAMECFGSLAEQGNEYAQIIMGILYLQGKQSKSDRRQAEYWFKEAEAQGSEIGKEFLKSMKRKSGLRLKDHDSRYLSKAVRALRKSVQKESRRALGEYEFEQSLETEIAVE